MRRQFADILKSDLLDRIQIGFGIHIRVLIEDLRCENSRSLKREERGKGQSKEHREVAHIKKEKLDQLQSEANATSDELGPTKPWKSRE